MAEEFDAKVKIDTGDAVKALKGVVTELGKTNVAAKGLSNDGLKAAEKASRDLAKAQKESQKQAQDLTSAVSGTTDQIGRMSPVVGNAVSSIGSMTSNTVALAGAMGPVGIAIGAVTAAMSFLSTEAEKGITVVERVTASFGEMRHELMQVTAAIEQTASAQRSYNELVTGAASIEQTAAAYRASVEVVSELQSELARAESQQRRLGALDVFGTMADNVGDIRARLRGAQQESRRLADAMRIAQGAAEASARESEKIARETVAARIAEKARGDEVRETVRARRDETGEIERQARLWEQQRERAFAFWRAEEQRERDRADAAIDQLILDEGRAMDDEANMVFQQAMWQGQKEHDRIAAEARQKEIADAEALNALKERQIQIQQRAAAGMEGVLDIAIRTRQLQEETNLSFAEALRESIKEFLASFAIEQAYKAIAAFAEAISMSVTNPPGAASKAAAGAMHAGIAAAAGGASVAIPAAGAAGAAPSAATPDAAGDQGGGGGGGGTVVVNFNTPVAEAELGRMNARAQREAERTFGRV